MREGACVDILAIDLGGTNVRFALAERLAGGGARWRLGPVRRLAAADHPSLGAALRAYLAEGGPSPRACGVGVPGPVSGRTAKITNLPWRVDADELQEILRAPVALLNDLEAHALGAIEQGAAACTTLRAGVPDPAGNAAMIAPGTGLGEALLFRNPETGRLVPRASEGAHASFGPTTDEDVALFEFLRKRYEHVSWERVVSGRDGFRNVFDFLVATRRVEVPPALEERYGALPDIGAALLADAATGQSHAVEVLRRFARHLGAEAGNLALKALATAGVYLGGGLAPRVFELVPQQIFFDAFAAKGRFHELLARVPIYRVDDPDIALVGAAARAAQIS